ncbi:MAG: hypothetical protein R3E53_16420 [Myxococcota bacterium]
MQLGLLMFPSPRLGRRGPAPRGLGFDSLVFADTQYDARGLEPADAGGHGHPADRARLA